MVDPRPNSGFLSKWQRKLLRKSGRPPFAVAHELFGESGGEASAHRARGAALIVGMHPDEVTEVIVDAAIEAGRPFAVVPCCVFSRLFPFRRLRSGTPVTTHAHLCEYLMGKHPNVRSTKLPFAGKSTVIYLTSYDESVVMPRTAAESCHDCDTAT